MTKAKNMGRNPDEVFTLNLKIIEQILDQQGRRFLNIKKLDDNSNEYFISSYMRLEKEEEQKQIGYIFSILEKYIEVLNKKKNKKISLSEANIGYTKGKSFILDYLNQNWEGYKAGESLIKTLVPRNKKNEFYIGTDFIKELLEEDDYIFILFHLDRLVLSFDAGRLFNFIYGMSDISKIIEFALLPRNKMNKILQEEGVGRIEPLDKVAFKHFQTSIKEQSYIDEKDLKYIQEYIFKLLVAVHIKSHNMSGTEQKLYNRNEIIKSNKTDDKIDSTFSNDIFHIALYEPHTIL